MNIHQLLAAAKKAKQEKDSVVAAVRNEEANLHEAITVLDRKRPAAPPSPTHVPAQSTASTVTTADAPPSLEVRELTAAEAIVDSFLADLEDPNFPYDPSQLAFIEGLSDPEVQFAAGTGAAGTGKTTCTKATVNRRLKSGGIGFVNLSEYWLNGEDGFGVETRTEINQALGFVPAIAIVAFTGRASQQAKRNFPTRWHSNIMTIHRLLAYAPSEESFTDSETGVTKTRVVFKPRYDGRNRLPWDEIYIDESGMVSVDLWHRLLEALKPNCRVIFIGDINQLPPVHGRSIFGYAMSEWPVFELTRPHRQKGKNNTIVDAAWSVLTGRIPKQDNPVGHSIVDDAAIIKSLQWLNSNEWQYAQLTIPSDPTDAARQLVRFHHIAAMKTKLYDPNLDTIIVPTNGDPSKPDAPSYPLGQLQLNSELVLRVNKGQDRYRIDAQREIKSFAVGDKVMATKNDHTIGVTNGMNGIIKSIHMNPNYRGDIRVFGLQSDVDSYLATLDEPEDFELTIDDIANNASTHEKEDRSTGAASHVITVEFDTGAKLLEVGFSSFAEVASLFLAYATTCHKMQGGESEYIATVLHHCTGRMLYREWFYTALTRARSRHITFCTPYGLSTAISTQRIKGATLAEKVAVFTRLASKGFDETPVYIPHKNYFYDRLIPSKKSEY